MDFFNRGGTQDTESNGIRLTIFGVGGGGCNAIHRLAQEKAEFDKVNFIAANTDKMALDKVYSEGVTKIFLGKESTNGMGAGSNPDIGNRAANESKDEITEMLRGTNLLFITAGMGGGTGTGASPVIAGIAHDMGILTIGVVTKPFNWEGTKKMEIAERGIAELRTRVDVLVVVPNEKAFSCQAAEPGMLGVFRIADNILKNSILGVVNIVGRHSLINTDFADIRTVIQGKGLVHIGIGKACGENRVMEALCQACKDPLMDTSIKGAHHVIVNISSDYDVPAKRINEAFTMIPQVVAKDANIITGFGFHEQPDSVCVTIIATGFGDETRGENDAYRDKAQAAAMLLREVAPQETDESEQREEEEDVPPYLRFMREQRH